MKHLPLRARLRLKVLWWRHAWPFEWAHKPLCGRFQHDVLRIGRLHLCRSCVFLYAGLAIGLVLGLLDGASVFDHAPALLLGALVVGMASTPRWYRHWSRPVRDLLRASAGVTGGLLLAFLPVAPMFAAPVLTVVLVAAWLSRRQRARLISQACEGCPELAGEGVCSGYIEQAILVRQYEIAATSAVLATGYRPVREGACPQAPRTS